MNGITGRAVGNGRMKLHEVMIDREFGVIHPFNLEEFIDQAVLNVVSAMEKVRETE